MTNLILEAARFASLKHSGQLRRFSKKPYDTHTNRVAHRAMTLQNEAGEYVFGELAIVAAHLHDTLEDTDTTEEELLRYFPPPSVKIVVELTNTSKRDFPELDRAARKAIDRKRLKECMLASRMLKLVDRIENVTELIDDARWCFKADAFMKVYIPESWLLVESLMGTFEPLERELRMLCAERT